jgi:hypothetical protein
MCVLLLHYSLQTIVDRLVRHRPLQVVMPVINIFPGDVLREIFGSFMNEAKWIHHWSALVHWHMC